MVLESSFMRNKTRNIWIFKCVTRIKKIVRLTDVFQ